MAVSRKLLIVVILLLVAGIGFYVKKHYYYDIRNETGSGQGIVAFGDSLTFGFGAGKGEDWPSLVRHSCNCTILNKGISGETTADALSRVQRDVLALNPRIVIVGFGGNDILQRVPEGEMFQNLEELVGKIQDSGAMVVLLGINGFPLGGSLGKGYAELARKTGCVYVADILGGILTNTKLKSDQIHPNAAGYKVIADRIYTKLEPYL